VRLEGKEGEKKGEGKGEREGRGSQSIEKKAWRSLGRGVSLP